MAVRPVKDGQPRILKAYHERYVVIWTQ